MTITEERPPQEDLARQALGAPKRGVASRIASKTGGGFVQFFLVLFGILWTVPAMGLFIC